MLKLSQGGRNWQAWKILASLENTGKPGKYWQAWKILASLVFTGKLAGDGSGAGGGAVLGDVLIKE